MMLVRMLLMMVLVITSALSRRHHRAMMQCQRLRHASYNVHHCCRASCLTLIIMRPFILSLGYYMMKYYQLFGFECESWPFCKWQYAEFVSDWYEAVPMTYKLCYYKVTAAAAVYAVYIVKAWMWMACSTVPTLKNTWHCVTDYCAMSFRVSADTTVLLLTTVTAEVTVLHRTTPHGPSLSLVILTTNSVSPTLLTLLLWAVMVVWR